MNHLAHFPVDYSGTLRQAFRACLKHADESSLELLESLSVNEVQQIDLRAIKTIHQVNHNLALEIVDEGLEQFPDEVLLLHRKANILRVMGDVQGSIKACDLILESTRSISRRPSSAPKWVPKFGTKKPQQSNTKKW